MDIEVNFKSFTLGPYVEVSFNHGWYLGEDEVVLSISDAFELRDKLNNVLAEYSDSLLDDFLEDED